MWDFICVAFFSIILVQLKFPEGKLRRKLLGQRTLWYITVWFWNSARFSPLILEVQDTAGHKRREGNIQFRREKECCFWLLMCEYVYQTRPSLPTVGAVLCHWTSAPFLGVSPVQRKGNESHAERALPCPMGSSLYDIM